MEGYFTAGQRVVLWRGLLDLAVLLLIFLLSLKFFL